MVERLIYRIDWWRPLIESWAMQLPTGKEALRYFHKQALSQFVGFYIGMSSAGLVSRFIETRRVSNMWGLLAHKPVVDAGTFMIFQQIAAAMTGFVIFEIVSRNLKPFLGQIKPLKQDTAQP